MVNVIMVISLVVLIALLIVTLLNSLKLKKIMGTQEEMIKNVNDLKDQVQKIGEETKGLVTKVTDLETALQNQQNVTPELQAAFDALKAQVTVVDELVPDTTAPDAQADGSAQV